MDTKKPAPPILKLTYNLMLVLPFREGVIIEGFPETANTPENCHDGFRTILASRER
jgi:hypothetical protein